MLYKTCDALSGVGPALSAKLSKCGIKTVADLLFHLPYRYQDRTRITPISDLRTNDWAVIAGRVCKTEVRYGKRMMLYCYLEDKSGIIKLRFFHFNKAQVQAFNQGQMMQAFGEVREFANALEMIHPEYAFIEGSTICTVEEALTPIYSSTAGLAQTRLRQIVKKALAACKEQLLELEWMRPEELEQHHFHPIFTALELLHNPPPDTILTSLEEGTHPAIRRLVFDELIGQQVSMQFAKQRRKQLVAPSLRDHQSLHSSFLNQLPFSLTNAQHRVSVEIAQDLAQIKPMMRLVQGDVGSGKTVIAALAALQAVASGYQVAFMAPTELLSEQHAANLKKWLTPLGINSCRLSGKMKTSEKREVLAKIATHQCQLLIGTHALFQDAVQFSKLGLVIIDEQHRFGVEQRLMLQQKGQNDFLTPHQLLLTATPIPRTLAMTQFAHLDISIIDEAPPGRTPVTTAVISHKKREDIITRLQAAINEGRQAYWVCTLIEESEKLQCMAATATATCLQQQLPGIRVGLVHGRMKSVEKEANMAAFKQGELDLLVATTVIEVGVDVPNASLMVIENAERLGLSQLHQLRGRVGRGSAQSYCLLVYQSPLSSIGAERLQVMRETANGFIIAEKDLLLRGAGEFLGTRQTGYRQFKIANLQRDKNLLPLVTSVAEKLVKQTPQLAQCIAKRWLGEFDHFLQS